MFIITGGAGFIGSNIAKHFCDRGDDVVVVDTLGSDNIKWKNVARLPLDRIVAPQDLNAFLASEPEVSGIVHMGAISATTAIDGDEIVRTNFDLSRQLWDYCTEHQVPFVYASSAATYGDGSQGFDDNNDLAAMQALRPLNLYGWSKQWFDVWVLRQVEKGRPTPPRWAGLKFFNVYGPRELHKEDMMSIVSKYHENCAAGDPVKLFKSHHPDYEDGGQLRDFVYVRDCVNVVSWLLEDSGQSGIFNVGSGDARSFKDLVSAAYIAAGHKPEITYIDMPETLRGRYQYFTQANLDNLRNAGYTQPMTKLEDGVTDLMQSYLMTAHPQG